MSGLYFFGDISKISPIIKVGKKRRYSYENKGI